MSLLVPTVAAVAGAGVYGVTGVLQQRATHRVHSAPGDQVSFIRGLIRQPMWVLSTAGSAGGFALQGIALTTGPIVLVQPLLVTGVLFAALTGFALRRGPVDWQLLTGLIMTAGGLALFLVAARPEAGNDLLTLGQVIPLAVVLAVLVFGCLAIAVRTSPTYRSLALAFASGIVYGVTAAVAKVALSLFGQGAVALLTSWSLWALVVLGPTGFLLNQHAFREGVLASPVVAVITVTDPMVGIGIGLLWLGERVSAEPGAIAAQVLGLLIMACGVWLVTHRAPHLSAEDGAAGTGTDASPRVDAPESA